jgi:hypothetical protein
LRCIVRQGFEVCLLQGMLQRQAGYTLFLKHTNKTDTNVALKSHDSTSKTGVYSGVGRQPFKLGLLFFSDRKVWQDRGKLLAEYRLRHQQAANLPALEK